MSAGSLADGVSAVSSAIVGRRSSWSHLVYGRPVARGRIRGPGGYRSGLVGKV